MLSIPVLNLLLVPLLTPVHCSPYGGNHREKCPLDAFLLPQGFLLFCFNEEPDLDYRLTSSSSSLSPLLSPPLSAAGDLKQLPRFPSRVVHFLAISNQMPLLTLLENPQTCMKAILAVK